MAYRILKLYEGDKDHSTYRVIPCKFRIEYIGIKGWYFCKKWADIVCYIKNKRQMIK